MWDWWWHFYHAKRVTFSLNVSRVPMLGAARSPSVTQTYWYLRVNQHHRHDKFVSHWLLLPLVFPLCVPLLRLFIV